MPASTRSARGDLEQLFQAVRRGDQDAFTSLMGEYEPMLRAIVEAGFDPQLRALVEPDDVMQEIRITVYRRLSAIEFRGPGAFYRWLESVAGSRLGDVRRRHFTTKRNPNCVKSLEDVAGLSPSGTELQVADEVCTSRPGPASVAYEHEREARLEDVLALIAPHDRWIIEQTHVQRRSTAAIAAECRLSEEAVRKKLSRALEACRDVLARMPRGKPGGDP